MKYDKIITVFYLSQNGSKSYLPFSFFYIYVKTKYDTLKWFLLKVLLCHLKGSLGLIEIAIYFVSFASL